VSRGLAVLKGEDAMPMTIVCLLWISAFIATIISALGKVPLWVAVLLASIAGLLGCLPLR
jgi:hypothetical protein